MSHEWYFSREGEVFGPFPEEELPGLFREGRLSKEDFLWRIGMADWARAGEIEDEILLEDETLFPSSSPEPAGEKSARQNAFCKDQESLGENELEDVPPEDLSSLNYLMEGIRNLGYGFKTLFKDKKRLLFPVFILTIVWGVQLALEARGTDSSSLRFLNFLTFAQGGAGGGFPGFLGGILGKGLFAYLFTLLVMPLISGRRPSLGLGSIKTLPRLFAVRDIYVLSYLLLGAGTSLIAYNFLSGDASPINSMAGIVGFILTLRALSNQEGFFRGFIRSLIRRFSKKDYAEPFQVNQVIAGMTGGFALSLPLSFIPLSSAGYIAGMVLVAASLAARLLGGRRKEVTET